MADRNSLYGLLGHPVSHVRSPGIFNAHLTQAGLPGHMAVFDVKPEALKVVLDGLRPVENLIGFFVTMPYKETIVPLLDHLTETARIAGAVNIVRRAENGAFTGGQLDGSGFVTAMQASGVEPRGRRAYIAGAGGVGAGICCALAMAGIGYITIANRNLPRAEALANRLRGAFAGVAISVTSEPPGADVDIVINATSLGLSKGDPAAIDLAAIRPGIFVGDVVNIPETTPLLKAAEQKGCITQHGNAMFGPQIALALQFYGGS